MAREIPLGAKGSAEETVEFKHTLTFHHPQLPPVYSTPDMIRLMETAAFHALHPFMDEGEITVGTAINIEHRAPTFEGTQLRAEAELASFDGRFYVLQVRVREGEREIGSGTVTRAVVNVAKFKAKYAR